MVRGFTRAGAPAVGRSDRGPRIGRARTRIIQAHPGHTRPHSDGRASAEQCARGADVTTLPSPDRPSPDRPAAGRLDQPGTGPVTLSAVPDLPRVGPQPEANKRLPGHPYRYTPLAPSPGPPHQDHRRDRTATRGPVGCRRRGNGRGVAGRLTLGRRFGWLGRPALERRRRRRDPRCRSRCPAGPAEPAAFAFGQLRTRRVDDRRGVRAVLPERHHRHRTAVERDRLRRSADRRRRLEHHRDRAGGPAQADLASAHHDAVPSKPMSTVPFHVRAQADLAPPASDHARRCRRHAGRQHGARGHRRRGPAHRLGPRLPDLAALPHQQGPRADGLPPLDRARQPDAHHGAARDRRGDPGRRAALAAPAARRRTAVLAAARRGAAAGGARRHHRADPSQPVGGDDPLPGLDADGRRRHSAAPAHGEGDRPCPDR